MPAAAKAWAMPYPMPLAPPVINAVLPLRSFMLCCSSRMYFSTDYTEPGSDQDKLLKTINKSVKISRFYPLKRLFLGQKHPSKDLSSTRLWQTGIQIVKAAFLRAKRAV
jgi:hypothetical protein